MRARMERSAVRLLKNIFRRRPVRDPDLDPAEVKLWAARRLPRPGTPRPSSRAGGAGEEPFGAARRLRKKVYIPDRPSSPIRTSSGHEPGALLVHPVERSLAEQYFQWTDTTEEADLRIVFIEAPSHDGGYSGEEAEGRRKRLLPITLQVPSLIRRHCPSAQHCRRRLPGGFTDRKDRGKTGTAANEADLDLGLDTRAAMGINR